MVAYSFNAHQYEPKYGGSGGLPAGKYKVIISDTKQVPTRSGDGGYLAVELRVVEGPQQGGTHTDRLNLHNQNPETVRIANNQLSAYCHVIGKFQFNDTSELHNIPFMVEIGPQKNDPTYTEVKKLFDVNGNEPGKSGSGPQAQMGGGQPQGGPPPGFGPQGGAPQGGGGWGGQGGGQPQQDQNQGQGGGWGQGGGQQPQQGGQGGGWGGQPQGDPNAGQQQGGGWGGQQQGQGQGQGQGGGWSQGGGQGGGAPGWGPR